MADPGGHDARGRREEGAQCAAPSARFRHGIGRRGPGSALTPVRDPGLAAVELLVAGAVAGLLTLLVYPSLHDWAATRRLRAATAELRVAVAAIRAAAAAGRSRALVFESTGRELAWSLVADGDGDGVRSADLRSGVDPRLLGPVSVPARHRGVSGGLAEGASPLGTSDGDGGVAFGRGRSLSCRTGGGCTSGTVYLLGPAGQGAALRVYGPTARARGYLWKPDGKGWRALF